MSLSTAADTRPEVIDPRGMRVIWLLLISAFVAILNETTMGIAIPQLNVELGLDPALGQWLTSAFMLTMAVVIPITGLVLQRFSTRGVYLTAMTLFTLGTLICLMAPGFTVLLLGRIVQASGTAIMMPLLMTTVMNVVPEHSRGRIMGRAGIVMALAPAIGPTVSGLILDSLSWRWIFGLILPIAVIALLIGAKWMLNLGESQYKRIDVASVILSALGFGGAVFALSQLGSAHGTESADTPTSVIALMLGAAVVSLALFVWRQLRLQRREQALLDLRVFRSLNFTMAVVVMTILALAMFGSLTLLPLYLQNVVGLSATQAGLIVLPGSVVMGILGPIVGRIYDARGPRPLLIPGTMLVSAGLWSYSLCGGEHPGRAAGQHPDRDVHRPGDVLHPAVLGLAELAAPQPVLPRLRRAEHAAAGGRRRRRGGADHHDVPGRGPGVGLARGDCGAGLRGAVGVHDRRNRVLGGGGRGVLRTVSVTDHAEAVLISQP